MKLKALSIAFGVIVTVAALIGLGVVVSYRLHDWEDNYRYIKGWADCWQLIPTREELQQRLVAKGYDIGTTGVDGEIGPNTIGGWKQAENDRYAERSMCRNVRKFDKAMLAKVGVEK